MRAEEHQEREELMDQAARKGLSAAGMRGFPHTDLASLRKIVDGLPDTVQLTAEDRRNGALLGIKDEAQLLAVKRDVLASRARDARLRSL